jgi:AraC family transcriptional regulator of adaptative response/methylated-DNA-[protein]-cysteine methyltransferase
MDDATADDPSIDIEAAWRAFEARDRDADGRFVVAVTTTRIYCRAGCAARRPRRENVRFLRDGAAARAAGFRACLRCRPDEETRDRAAVARAVAMMEAGETPPTLGALATAAGYAPHHFHRLFRRATGVTPAAYARALRARRAADALDAGAPVTDAIYAAGYGAPSRFYDEAGARLGMTPGARAGGGAGVTIGWTIARTTLGPLLIAASARGPVRIAFDEDAATLAARFPLADLRPGGAALDARAAEVVARIESLDLDRHLPRDVQGTAFREAVWQALAAAPEAAHG